MGNNKGLLHIFIGFSVLSFIVCGLLWWSTQKTIDSYHEVKSDFNTVRDSVYRDSDDADFLSENLPEFVGFRNQGKIGAPERIAWVEALESIGEIMQLSDFQYEMNPAEIIEDPALKHAQLQKVNITLRVGFAHDGEIFEFFAALSKNISAIYDIAELDVRRTKGDRSVRSAESSQPVKLKVVCQINWYSIVLSPVNAGTDV